MTYCNNCGSDPAPFDVESTVTHTIYKCCKSCHVSLMSSGGYIDRSTAITPAKCYYCNALATGVVPSKSGNATFAACTACSISVATVGYAPPNPTSRAAPITRKCYWCASVGLYTLKLTSSAATFDACSACSVGLIASGAYVSHNQTPTQPTSHACQGCGVPNVTRTARATNPPSKIDVWGCDSCMDSWVKHYGWTETTPKTKTSTCSCCNGTPVYLMSRTGDTNIEACPSYAAILGRVGWTTNALSGNGTYTLPKATAKANTCNCCNGTATKKIKEVHRNYIHDVCDKYAAILLTSPDCIDVTPGLRPSNSSGSYTYSPTITVNGTSVDFNNVKINLTINPSCECGATKCGSNAHSGWCPCHSQLTGT